MHQIETIDYSAQIKCRDVIPTALSSVSDMVLSLLWITFSFLPLDPGEADFQSIAIIDWQSREIPVFRLIGHMVHEAPHNIFT